MLTGKFEFILIPVQHITDRAAVGGVFMMFSLQPAVNAEHPGIGFITDMARLYDDHVLAVVCVWTVPVGSDDAANTAMIEWKRAKVLGNKNDGIALVLVRAERPGWHDVTGLHTQGQAKVEQPRRKHRVAHGVLIDRKTDFHSFMHNDQNVMVAIGLTLASWG